MKKTLHIDQILLQDARSASGARTDTETVKLGLEARPSGFDSSPTNVVAFVSDRRLNGRGIGWTDVHVLASALVGRVLLWTADAPLATVAKELGVSYD